MRSKSKYSFLVKSLALLLLITRFARAYASSNVFLTNDAEREEEEDVGDEEGEGEGDGEEDADALFSSAVRDSISSSLAARARSVVPWSAFLLLASRSASARASTTACLNAFFLSNIMSLSSVFILCRPSSYFNSHARSASALYLDLSLDVILDTSAASSCARFLVFVVPVLLCWRRFPSSIPSIYFFSQAFNASSLYLFFKSDNMDL